MARYVLPVAGAVVGGIFGGPLGAQIGWAVGSALGGIVDPQVIKGPSIGDIAQQTSQEGSPRPIVIGLSQPMAGNIIATSQPQIVRTRKRQGKGGPKVETESIYRTYAIRICEGPIERVIRVWRNNQLIYDVRENSSMSDTENNNFLTKARFFYGTFDQNPSPDLEAVFGVGTTPAHRGTAYMVMAGDDLTDLRGAIPSYQFQVSSESGGAVLVAIATQNEFSTIPSQAVARSIDGGETWTMITTPMSDDDSADWLSVAYSPTLDRLVAVGNRAGNSAFIDTMYSDDKGLTWTSLYTGITNGSNFWSSVIWVPDNGGFFLAGCGSQSGAVDQNHMRKSVDGISWTAIDLTALIGSKAIGDICYSRDLQRLVCIHGLGTNGLGFAYSDDFGVTWIESSFGGMTWDPAGSGVHITGVDWSSTHQKFIALGRSGSAFSAARAVVSSDGDIWADDSTPFNNNGPGFRVRDMPGFGVVLGTEGPRVGKYTGGSTFSGVTTIGTGNNNGLAWDPSRDRAMIVGSTTKFAYQEELDGAWTTVALPAPKTWTDVVACYTGLESLRLPSVVARICERAGMTSDMYDVSLLDPEIDVHGLTLINTYPAYAALQTLSQVFYFSPAYYDGVLHFVHGGADTVETVTENDMVDDHEIEIEETLRDDPLTVPRVMHLLYYDVLGGLATDKQTSERAGDYRSLGEQTIQSPVMMTAEQAARAIAINHKVSIENLRGTLKFCLPDSFISLTPSDHVIVQANGFSKRVRLTKVEILEGYQQYEMLHDRQSAYTSDVEGIPAAPQTDPPSNVVGPTLIQPLDIHIIRDADDNAGLIYYVAISGTTPAWTGALIELSFDGGANYVDALSSSTDTIMGTLRDPLPDHPQAFPDEEHVLAVDIATPYAEFDETDLTGLLNQLNYAIVGNEIIQFAEADEVSEGSWDLSLLIRGRHGTATAYHPAGERFVMLERSSLGVIPSSIVEIGRTFTFRATSFGETEDTGTVISMVYEGRSQIEREPAYLQAYMSGVDAVVSWQGVGRLGSGAQVAHGARFAGYHVTFEGSGMSDVPIELDTLAQSVTQDVSSLTAPIRIAVSQLNDLTGAGPEIELYI